MCACVCARVCARACVCVCVYVCEEAWVWMCACAPPYTNGLSLNINRFLSIYYSINILDI